MIMDTLPVFYYEKMVGYIPEKKPVQFTPIPMSYTNLLPYFLDNQMVVVSSRKIYQPPFPWWYNPNVTCSYHGGVSEHSIEQCVDFQEDSPNIRTNPLANHGSSFVNTIEKGEFEREKRRS